MFKLVSGIVITAACAAGNVGCDKPSDAGGSSAAPPNASGPTAGVTTPASAPAPVAASPQPAAPTDPAGTLADPLAAWAAALDSGDAQRRLTAVAALGKFKAERPQDVDRHYSLLSRALGDRDAVVASTAAYALASLGDRGARRLVDAIADGDDPAATVALAAIPKAGTTVIGPLIELFRTNLQTGGRAAVALASIGRPAVPALIEAASDYGEKSNQVRAIALFTLGEMGPEARAALPIIRERTTDRNTGVRKAATRALRQVAGSP